MSSPENNCGQCNKHIPLNIRIIKCGKCNQFFHVKCCGINHKTFNTIKSGEWNCKNCETENINAIPDVVVTRAIPTKNVNVASVRIIYLPTYELLIAISVRHIFMTNAPGHSK